MATDFDVKYGEIYGNDKYKQFVKEKAEVERQMSLAVMARAAEERLREELARVEKERVKELLPLKQPSPYSESTPPHDWTKGPPDPNQPFGPQFEAAFGIAPPTGGTHTHARATDLPPETRTVDPRTGAMKGEKLARFDLIAVTPLWELAVLCGKGAIKYGVRNWEKGYAWSLSYSAMQRHINLFWAGEELDACKPECKPGCTTHTGVHHLTCAMWHAMVLREYIDTHPAGDDRPKDDRPKKVP